MRPPALSGPVVGSEIELVELLETAYRNRDADLYQSLLADRDGAAFLFETRSGPGRVSAHWGVDKERRLHRRMFAPERTPPDEPPVPDDLGIVDVAISLTPGTFRERTEYYQSAGGALSPDRWRALGGVVHVGLFVQTRGRPLDGVRGSVELVVVEDLQRPAGSPGKYLLYRWWDPTYKVEAAATPSMSWSALKLAYGEGLGIDCGGALVDEFAAAYGTRDLSRFEALLAHEPGAQFSADLGVPTLDGRHTLDLETELLLHRRLFTPETAPPPTLEPGLHARTIQLIFDPISDFVETSAATGIDLGRWRATRARYRAQLSVETHGDEVLRSDWEVELVALEDRTLRFGQPGKFLLHRWGEADPGVLPVDENGSNPLPVRETWSDLKIVYLPPPAIDSERTLVRTMAFAYKRRDLARFAPLLAAEPGAEFAFVGPRGETWERIEESRIHFRMFRPELAFPELPAGQRIASFAPEFVLLQTEFVEVPEHYAAPGRPGLDPARWRATGARLYFSSAAWQQNGEGFVIGGESRWVVLEDRTKSHGEPGRYLLYRWLDEHQTLPLGWTSWTAFKTSYR